MIEDRLECEEDPLGILLTEDPDDTDKRLEVKGLLDRSRQCAGAMRVMGRIDDDRRAAPHDLEPAGGAHHQEALANGLDVELDVGGEEGLDRGQANRCVLRLMIAEERHEDVLVPAVQSLDREHLAADRDIARLD